IAELSGIANSRFDAGVCDQPDDDELMDAVLLELQVKVGVGEAAGAPMLRGNDLTRLRDELGAELAAPSAIFEALPLPSCLLNWRNVFPRLIVARTVAVMHGVEDPKFRLARGIQDLQHVWNAVVRFGDGFDAWPDLAALGNEIVVWIDYQKGSDLLFIVYCCHGGLPSRKANAIGRRLFFTRILLARIAAGWCSLNVISPVSWRRAATGYFCPAASRITAAILSGCDMRER